MNAEYDMASGIGKQYGIRMLVRMIAYQEGWLSKTIVDCKRNSLTMVVCPIVEIFGSIKIIREQCAAIAENKVDEWDGPFKKPFSLE